ncbi:hypothetical protein TGAM01_v205159 [Trichoderma gamsii]|uniref:Uncharacterized protein n=1 Tax=Trichoderma gamsii TaxID=398673 RepID=A0A2P4ZN51_9HYPO|nr:hypothetical protein TGAM01_v205159 [Trichoderma gamsii]PON25722.1 hypothetical protein TGAM01_v205159 [Trichoderma gamsii]
MPGTCKESIAEAMSQSAVTRSPPRSHAMLHQPCFWLSNLVDKGAVVPPMAEQQRWYEDGLWRWVGGGVQSNGRRCPPLPCRSVNLMHLAAAVGAGLQRCDDALDALDAPGAGLYGAAPISGLPGLGLLFFVVAPAPQRSFALLPVMAGGPHLAGPGIASRWTLCQARPGIWPSGAFGHPSKGGPCPVACAPLTRRESFAGLWLGIRRSLFDGGACPAPVSTCMDERARALGFAACIAIRAAISRV